VAVFLGLRDAPADATYTFTVWDWLSTGRFLAPFAFRVDHLAAVMLLVITGVGSLIHIYSVGYMKDDPGYARYFAYLNLFVVFMLVLVLGASVPVMFIGWEGVGLCSYLLIGFWFDITANSSAGKKAFIMNRIGDFGMLVAMFLLWWSLGTLDFQEIARLAPGQLPAGGALVTIITLLIFLGCTGKSAQIPLYTWLPDAMAGPTPVSALIHAATMVTAGVYLVVRTNVLFAMAPLSSSVVAGIGAATALFAALIALRQYDIKRVLAYSTVSQLGYMFLGVGTGAHAAGIFHLVTHAFFKALLFLGAGSVIHALQHAYHHTHQDDDPQDLRNMGGLRAAMPWTFALMLVATLALAGVPPLSGFFSKDEILAAAFGRGAQEPVWRIYWALGVAAAFLTAFYMARLMTMAFLGSSRSGAAGAHVHEAPWILTGPLVVLGILSAVGGVINLPSLVGGHHWLETWLDPVVEPARTLLSFSRPHGPTEAALVAAAVVVALGGLYLGWRATSRSRLLPADQAMPDRGFAAILHRKFYVDEIYQALIVRPVHWLSEVVLWKVIDQGLIDSVAVEGPARVARSVGWIGSRLQTGQLGIYVIFFLVGALWVLRAVMW
ncbi:MAG: NADH-quinone oxidoreductase subunit L, partial [Gemmatimonadota bacterium]